MKTQYLILAAVSLLVLALLALIWPITRRSTSGPRLATLISAQKLVSDLTEIRSSATRNLRQAVQLRGRLAHIRQATASVSSVARPASSRGSGSAKVWGWPDPAADADNTETPQRRSLLTWPDLQLTGIVAAGSKSMAVINGEVYRLRELVRDLQLTAIDDDAVVLTSANGESRRLSLSGWDKEASK